MTKYIFINCFIVAFITVINGSCSLGSPIENSASTKGLELSQQDSVIPSIDTISITAVGDIMMGTDYPSSRSLPPEDGRTLFKGVKKYLMDADLTFGNLEGVIGRGGTAKSCNNPKYSDQC